MKGTLISRSSIHFFVSGRLLPPTSMVDFACRYPANRSKLYDIIEVRPILGDFSIQCQTLIPQNQGQRGKIRCCVLAQQYHAVCRITYFVQCIHM